MRRPTGSHDPQLRLWILDAKGALDLEINVASARQVYEETRQLARKLGDKAREARASGELGIIAFLDGGTGDAMQLLGEALRTSIELKDVGAHIRYLNLMGNGLSLFRRPENAIRYYDRALQLVRSTPELDTSLMAVAGFQLPTSLAPMGTPSSMSLSRDHTAPHDRDPWWGSFALAR